MVHLLLAVLVSAFGAPTDETAGSFSILEPHQVQIAGLVEQSSEPAAMEPSDCCVAGAPCCKRVRDSYSGDDAEPAAPDAPTNPPTNVNEDAWWLADSTGAPGSFLTITAETCAA
ncbi:MAG: hypothetical protein AAGD01_07135 [Acidobacteriota bacterium]